MSVLEKKALAFEKLAALNNEEGIDEILEHLERLNSDAKTRVYNLSKLVASISQQFDETLKKLAE